MDNFIALAVSIKLKKSTPAMVRKRITEYLSKRIRIPYPSAGSFFKNPSNVPAAQLIDQAGLKGVAIGGAAIFEKHANILINKNSGIYRDFTDLMEFVIGEVYISSGEILLPEIKFWS